MNETEKSYAKQNKSDRQIIHMLSYMENLEVCVRVCVYECALL